MFLNSFLKGLVADFKVLLIKKIGQIHKGIGGVLQHYPHNAF
ncbi:hypothetical protein HPHPA14_0456 [Helicobacter pylori Hp A-14]|nr:hypothetical protein HPHPA14_0456 [Helicobacter pylori Hp A-14]